MCRPLCRGLWVSIACWKSMLAFVLDRMQWDIRVFLDTAFDILRISSYKIFITKYYTAGPIYRSADVFNRYRNALLFYTFYTILMIYLCTDITQKMMFGVIYNHWIPSEGNCSVHWCHLYCRTEEYLSISKIKCISNFFSFRNVANKCVSASKKLLLNYKISRLNYIDFFVTSVQSVQFEGSVHQCVYVFCEYICCIYRNIGQYIDMGIFLLSIFYVSISAQSGSKLAC